MIRKIYIIRSGVYSRLCHVEFAKMNVYNGVGKLYTASGIVHKLMDVSDCVKLCVSLRINKVKNRFDSRGGLAGLFLNFFYLSLLAGVSFFLQ